MNIFECLNEITEYIENHLTGEIDYKYLSKIMGVNEYTMRRIFSLLCNVTIADYIRKRKLSDAAYLLYYKDVKVIDVALKYGYENATSFSRAFTSYHGIKPSRVKKEYAKLKNFPRITFDGEGYEAIDISYCIIDLPSLELYGFGISTSIDEIKKEAPLFYHEMTEKYGAVPYAITYYKDVERFLVDSYWCLYKDKIKNSIKKEIPESKWLAFQINVQDEKEIQKAIAQFYQKFLPSCKFNLRDLPEIEYYHDDICEFLIAIE